MFRKRILCILFCMLCLVSAACASASPSSQSPASTPRPTATTPVQPTATSLPAGTVLYQADWSHGLSQWQASGGWQVSQGQLEVAANNLSEITIPYRPTVANYAIEVRLEIVSLIQGEGGYWVIFGQRQPGKDGFQTGALGIKGSEERMSGSHGQAQVIFDPLTAMGPGVGQPVDYDPGFKWHTYRVEVLENSVRLRDNGVSLAYGSSVDSDYITNGPLGLECDRVVLRIASIRVLAM
jgi:hypothetical protein